MPETLERRGRRLVGEGDAHVARGETVLAELDGHKQLILLRVAAILAVWDGRSEVSEDDWDTAGEIWKTSCGVRDWIIAERRRIEEEAEAEKTRRAAMRAVVVSHAVKTGDARIDMLARRVALKVHEKGPLTNKQIRDRVLTGRSERSLMSAILEAADGYGWIEPDGEKAWKAGHSKPA